MISLSNLLKNTRETLGLDEHKHDASYEERLRLKHYLVFILFGSPVILAFAIFNLVRGHAILYGLLFSNLGVFFVSWCRVFSSSRPKQLYRVSICTYAILLCYNFSHGGILEGRSLWLYTFPLIIFFLLGNKEGLIWVIIVPIVALLFHFSPFSPCEPHDHNLGYLLRYLTVYAMLSAITYWFEYFRSHFRDNLHLEHARFQEILHHSKDILYRKNLTSGRYDYISHAFGAHLGYPQREFTQFDQTDIAAMVHPDDRKSYMSLLQTLKTASQTHPTQTFVEFRMRHKDGDYLWFRDHIAVVNNENHEAEAIIGSSREVTQLRIVEEGLQHAKQQLLTILDAIDAHIYVSDMDTYEILYINDRMERDFGSELNGKVCWREFRKTEQPCKDCSNNMLLDADNNSTGVYVWEGYNEITNHWYLNHDRAIRWIDGRWVRIQIAVDITRQKYLEEERKYNSDIISRTRQLETISTLTGGIAHDFNNLLQVILGNIAIIENDSTVEEIQQSSFDELKSAAQKASDLVTKMMTISSAQPKYHLAMPIVPFLEQISLECTEGLSIKREFDIQSDLWAVLIDYNQITTAVRNVIQNACESIASTGVISIRAENFTQEKGAETHQAITFPQTSGLQAGKYVKVTIEDSGRGMEQEQLEKVFEPYFTTKFKSSVKGLGLGLTITYAIITQHRGTIALKSHPGEGTIVTFFLPTANEKIDYRTA